jgi:hypothetical protein
MPVLPAVDLDDQAGFQAREVDDESSDRHLSTEMKTLRPQRAKADPDLRFLTCHPLAKQSSRSDPCYGIWAAPGA